MSEEHKVSDELRNAFVDGELDAAEWARVAQCMERDAALREEVCELRMAKDMVRHAYAEPPARRRAREAAASGWRSIAAAAVAFAAAGWFGHAWWERAPALDSASAYALRGDWHTLRADWRTLDGNRVLVHVSSGAPAALGTALDEVEDLLRSARAGHRRVEVEIVANGTGIDLLRANASPYATRIAVLRREFPQLGIVACGQTLERRRADGKQFTLLPGTAIAPSALDEVIRRLRDGWVYVRV
jgi:intracellular sulfur oxidation DsrE/DsrF family protein